MRHLFARGLGLPEGPTSGVRGRRSVYHGTDRRSLHGGHEFFVVGPYRVSMRIIAGEYRSRRLVTPRDAEVTRPMPDRVRESLFMLLRGHFEGATVFDGFSGTGAIGLEAVSRGAAKCVLVEQDRGIVEILRQNVFALGCGDRCEVFAGDALGAGALARCPRPLKLAFLDPPYPLIQEPIGFRRVMAQLSNLIELLTPDGFAVLRTPWPMVVQTPVASVSAGSRPVREATKKDKRSRVKKGRTWRRHGEAMDPKRAAEQLGEEEDEVEVPEGAPVAAAAAPVSEPVPADLHLPNAVGPETHTYKTMALHLYAKKPRE